MRRSGPIQQNGEMLLFSDAGRRELPVWSLVLGLGAPALWVAGVGIAPRYLEQPWPAAITFAGFLLFFIPLDMFFLGWWFERWRVAVTDRRVVQRKGPFGLWRKELDLSRLQDIRHDWQADPHRAGTCAGNPLQRTGSRDDSKGSERRLPTAQELLAAASRALTPRPHPGPRCQHRSTARAGPKLRVLRYGKTL